MQILLVTQISRQIEVVVTIPLLTVLFSFFLSLVNNFQLLMMKPTNDNINRGDGDGGV